MKEENPVLIQCEKSLSDILPLLKKIARRHLGKMYSSDIEDVIQNTLKNLWRFVSKQELTQKFLSEDLPKIANTAIHNQIISFHRKKKREVLFSEYGEKSTSLIRDPQPLEGNTDLEAFTQLLLIWKKFQKLSYRQKYSFLLQNQPFITLLCRSEFCTLKEIARHLALSQKEFMLICERVPLSDEEIQILLKNKIGLELTVKQIWIARNRAKANLLQVLKNQNKNDRTFT